MHKPNCLSSDEIYWVLGSKRFNSYVPRITPVVSLPKRRGSLSISKILPNRAPQRNTRANDTNISNHSNPFQTIKNWWTCVCHHRSHQLKSGFDRSLGSTSFPKNDNIVLVSQSQCFLTHIWHDAYICFLDKGLVQQLLDLRVCDWFRIVSEHLGAAMYPIDEIEAVVRALTVVSDWYNIACGLEA